MPVRVAELRHRWDPTGNVGCAGNRSDELLEWAEARAGIVACRKVAAPGRVCLSELQNCATAGTLLAMWAVRATIRHVREQGHLSSLRCSVWNHEMSGLWGTAPARRVDRSHLPGRWYGERQLLDKLEADVPANL